MYYHGTRRPFQRGGLLLPRSYHGGDGTSAPLTSRALSDSEQHVVDESSSYVYITTNVAIAWAYAWSAPGRGKPRVLTVAPTSDIEPDPEHSPLMEAYRCDGARVISVSLDPLLTEQEAADGWEQAT